MIQKENLVFIAIRSFDVRGNIQKALGCGKFANYVSEPFYRIKDAFGVWERKAQIADKVVFITDQEDIENGKGPRSLLLTLRERELEHKLPPAIIVFVGRQNAKHTLSKITPDIKGSVECVFVPIEDKDIDPFVEQLQLAGV